jgi:hypothetical protein
MISISKDDIKNFVEKGWVQVSLGLSSNSIQRYFNSVQKLEEKAASIQYPMGRIYHPHMFDNNKAAIETPFNKLIINEDIKSLFKEIKLGNAVRNLMGWENTYCELARLFTMNKYKYRGQWHRDCNTWDGEEDQAVQVAIYLQDQSGFRLLKNEYELQGLNKNKISNDFAFEQAPFPLDIDKKYYDSIDGKAGTVLFFVPSKLHQGSTFNKRLDFHMRFTAGAFFPTKKQAYKFDKNSFQDFYCRDIYETAANYMDDSISPRITKIKSLTRIKNSINYYSGTWNLAASLKYFYKYGKLPAPWKFDLLSNTIYQKK